MYCIVKLFLVGFLYTLVCSWFDSCFTSLSSNGGLLLLDFSNVNFKLGCTIAQLRANIDTQIRKISSSNEINLTINDKIDFHDRTERFINVAKTNVQLVHKTLSNLPKNSSIKLCKMDKGNGVKFDYFNKLHKIVLD